MHSRHSHLSEQELCGLIGEFPAPAGIPTMIDPAHAIAHNKVMITDGETVITASFNSTEAPEEKNAENLLIINDKDLAARYTEKWK
jgi:phosphatidylserine/phosphatidylglycerophosphate/cardiolipin synthase-like enzyme